MAHGMNRHHGLTTIRRRKINPADLAGKRPVYPALGLIQSLSFGKWQRTEGVLPKDRQIRAQSGGC